MNISRKEAHKLNPLIDDIPCNTIDRVLLLINLLEEHALAQHDLETNPESLSICLQVIRHALEYESSMFLLK